MVAVETAVVTRKNVIMSLNHIVGGIISHRGKTDETM